MGVTEIVRALMMDTPASAELERKQDALQRVVDAAFELRVAEMRAYNRCDEECHRRTELDAALEAIGRKPTHTLRSDGDGLHTDCEL